MPAKTAVVTKALTDKGDMQVDTVMIAAAYLAPAD